MERRRILLAAAAILACAPLRAAEPEPVSVRPPPHPIAAVGVVLKDGVAVCTGSLVAPDLVVTAAHCAQGVDADAARLRFRTGAYPGVTPVERAGVRLVRHPLFPAPGEEASVERRTGYDLALLRLAEEVPGTAATPLASGRAQVAQPRVLVASYRGGRGERARERTCPVIAASDRMIEMGCDVRPGESGSPVLQRGPDGLVLVGVLSARAEDGPQKLAIAAGSARIGQLRALMGPELPAP